MKWNKTYLPLFLGAAIASGVYIGSKLNFTDTTEKIFATNSKKDKLNRLIDYIDYEYVDEVNTDSIVDVTVNGILENLDPHSVYIPVDDYQANADDMRGAFTGIGISFYVPNDTIAVIKVIEGGPADRAGIKASDRILYADGIQLFGEEISRDSISAYLKGEINSKVDLQLFRKSENQLINVTLKRKEVPLVSVDAAYVLDNKIGYIKVNRFSETTFEEFEEALSALKDEKIKSLILDLRGNPGGYISAAEQIADEFLEDDKLILVTRNKKGDESETFATRTGEFEEGNVYVLVDQNSASASEIVAGALQDNDKGTIIGRRSFGKGLVQREMSLGDGSAVRLTIARYYTPTGRSIQRPYGNGNDAYYSEYENRYRNGELRNADSIQVADSLKFVTLGGKVVYGGGGITPDVFIPKDISIENETIVYVTRSGFMSYFIFEFLDENRYIFDGIPFIEYAKGYEIEDDLVEEFLTYARLSEARIDLSEYREALKIAIKANIAEQVYGTSAFEYILNQEDPMIQKVLEMEEALRSSK